MQLAMENPQLLRVMAENLFFHSHQSDATDLAKRWESMGVAEIEELYSRVIAKMIAFASENGPSHEPDDPDPGDSAPTISDSDLEAHANRAVA